LLWRGMAFWGWDGEARWRGRRRWSVEAEAGWAKWVTGSVAARAVAIGGDGVAVALPAGWMRLAMAAAAVDPR
jgi:hypothetical protein